VDKWNLLRISMKYSDEILELIRDREKYTQSDLQSRAAAIVINVMYEVKGDIYVK
jgi:predicted transcriptional regulator